MHTHLFPNPFSIPPRRFNAPVASSWSCHVEGTGRLLELAESCKRQALLICVSELTGYTSAEFRVPQVTFVHVSTAFVHCKVEAEEDSKGKEIDEKLFYEQELMDLLQVECSKRQYISEYIHQFNVIFFPRAPPLPPPSPCAAAPTATS